MYTEKGNISMQIKIEIFSTCFLILICISIVRAEIWNVPMALLEGGWKIGFWNKTFVKIDSWICLNWHPAF